jgi:tetratricopeptide (TPR) repeat protein
MGFRLRKSFKVMPGVRMTVTPKGVGVSAGTRGARMSVHSSGRVTKTVGVPGSGMSYVSTSTPSKRSTTRRAAAPQAQQAAPKPGLMAPKGEKALYAALTPNVDASKLAEVVSQFPEYALVANTVLGFALEDQRLRAEGALKSVFDSGRDPAQEPFARKYLGASHCTVAIADGVKTTLPLNRDAVGLMLAELLQADGNVGGAIDVVEQLEPSTHAAVSLAELYVDAKRYDAAVELTEGVMNQDDATALLCVFRGVALRERGYVEASKAAFKEALRSRSRDRAIRHRALMERARMLLADGKKAQARKDLERILADDSKYPGLTELLAATTA